MKRIIALLLGLLMLFLCSGCLSGQPTKIKSADFGEAKKLVQERYELTLPESALFYGGYFDHAFRDPSIILAFTIDQADLAAMFSENWLQKQSVDELTIMEEYLVLPSYSPVGEYDFQGELYTHLWYAKFQTNRYLCVLMGRHPGDSF